MIRFLHRRVPWLCVVLMVLASGSLTHAVAEEVQRMDVIEMLHSPAVVVSVMVLMLAACLIMAHNSARVRVDANMQMLTVREQLSVITGLLGDHVGKEDAALKQMNGGVATIDSILAAQAESRAYIDAKLDEISKNVLICSAISKNWSETFETHVTNCPAREWHNATHVVGMKP